MEEKKKVTKGVAVVERLRQYAKEHDMPISRIEAAMGKQKAYLYQVKNPTVEVIISALEAFDDLSAEWLLRGKEESVDANGSKRVEYLMNQLMDSKREIEQLKMELHLLKEDKNA